MKVGACILQIDTRRCKQCETCEGMLPGFLTQVGGNLLISSNSMEKENVLQAVADVLAICPEGAIALLPYPIASLSPEILLSQGP
jgi:hypothetical protein